MLLGIRQSSMDCLEYFRYQFAFENFHQFVHDAGLSPKISQRHEGHFTWNEFVKKNEIGASEKETNI